MEFYSGGELYQHLKRAQGGRFPESRAKFYCAQVILALEYLHKHNIVYRDMKPENIVMGSDGYISLTDFGISRNIEEDENHDILGTIGYVAPETWKTKTYSKATDYWQFGILLYFYMKTNFILI